MSVVTWLWLSAQSLKMVVNFMRRNLVGLGVPGKVKNDVIIVPPRGFNFKIAMLLLAAPAVP